MKPTKNRRTLIIFASLLLFVSACSGAEGESGDQGEPVKIGFLVSITGDYAPWGEAALPAARMAVEAINAAGGISGRPIELVVADAESTVEATVAGYNRLVEVEGVVAIAGPESDGAVALIDSVAEDKVPMLCPFCGTSVLDTKGGNFLWRIRPSDNDNGTATAQFAVDLGFERVSMLVQNTEGTLSVARNFIEAWEGLGKEIANDIRFEPGGAGAYQAEVAQAFADDPEAVYLAAGSEAAIPIFREWERRGYDSTLLLTGDTTGAEESVNDQERFSELSHVLLPVHSEQTPAFEAFSEEYEARTGEAPSEDLAQQLFYDSLVMLALAATAGEEITGESIADNMLAISRPPGTLVYSYEDGVRELEAGNDIDYWGASGNVDLGEGGSLRNPRFGVLRWNVEDQAWELVEEMEVETE